MTVCWIIHGDLPNDGGKKHLWNVGKLLSDYTARTTTQKTVNRTLAAAEPEISKYSI
jgi:hypothetical protein